MRRPEELAKHVYQAAMAQTVTVSGSTTAARLIGALAVQLAAVFAPRVEKETKKVLFRPARGRDPA